MSDKFTSIKTPVAAVNDYVDSYIVSTKAGNGRVKSRVQVRTTVQSNSHSRLSAHEYND